MTDFLKSLQSKLGDIEYVADQSERLTPSQFATLQQYALPRYYRNVNHEGTPVQGKLDRSGQIHINMDNPAEEQQATLGHELDHGTMRTIIGNPSDDNVFKPDFNRANIHQFRAMLPGIINELVARRREVSNEPLNIQRIIDYMEQLGKTRPKFWNRTHEESGVGSDFLDESDERINRANKARYRR